MNQSHMTEIFISIGVCAFGLLLLLLRPLYDLAARVSQARKEYHALLRNGLMSDAPKENDRLLAERLAEGAKASPPAADPKDRISTGPKQPESRIPSSQESDGRAPSGQVMRTASGPEKEASSKITGQDLQDRRISGPAEDGCPPSSGQTGQIRPAVHPSPGPPTAPLEPPKPSPVRIRLKSGPSAAPPSERSSI
ncbi:MAG: hypothetical protein II166_01955 [Firmicutes bacterium]|nr:hypothetical protein [Bacillota bacterium]